MELFDVYVKEVINYVKQHSGCLTICIEVYVKMKDRRNRVCLMLFRKNIYPESEQHAQILLSRQTTNGDDKEQKRLHFTISIFV